MRSCLVLVVRAGCGGGWLSEPRILVDGDHAASTDCRTQICRHNENTDLTTFDGATYLVHRTALSQILGPNSLLLVSRSDDRGKTWRQLAVIPALAGRDLRDPAFYRIRDRLAGKALTPSRRAPRRERGGDT